jgi:hypothetical protein
LVSWSWLHAHNGIISYITRAPSKKLISGVMGHTYTKSMKVKPDVMLVVAMNTLICSACETTRFMPNELNNNSVNHHKCNPQIYRALARACLIWSVDSVGDCPQMLTAREACAGMQRQWPYFIFYYQ